MIKTNGLTSHQFRSNLKVKIVLSVTSLEDNPLKCFKREYRQSTNKEERIIILEELANFAYRRSLKATAICIHKTILRISKDSETSWKSIIELYVDRKKYQKALNICKEASIMFPGEIWPLKRQVNINQYYLKNNDEIVSICRRVLDDYPGDVYFREVLAEHYDRTEFFDKAFILYKQIIDLDPNNKAAQNWVKLYTEYTEKKSIVNKCKAELDAFFNDTETIKTQKKEYYTYFLLGVLTNLIKFGFTTREAITRKKELQTGSPDKLKIIAFVKGNFEKELKNQFKKYNVHGEWYIQAPEILSKIIELLVKELHANKNQ